jgi:hypothetical protein
MRRVIPVMLVACLLAVAPSPIYGNNADMSFPSCGTVTNRNSSHQFGQFAWLEYIVETQGVFDLCGQWVVQVEANVSEIANSGKAATAIMYASVRRQVPVPAYNRVYQTNGRHYASGTFPNIFNAGWWLTGNTSSQAMVVAPSTASNDPALACYAADGIWRDTWCDMKASSPIIVDSGRNGYALTSASDGVWFDLDADGIPEHVSWTERDGDDEFLAMDRNGNGVIDNGSELFGNHTPAYPEGPLVTTMNGFEALRFLQSPSYGVSRPDQFIDAADVPFARLLLWRDANHNGISEPGELRHLSDAGVISISTDYKEKKRTDEFGNQFRQRGSVLWSDGRDALYDVWLQRQD